MGQSLWSGMSQTIKLYRLQVHVDACVLAGLSLQVQREPAESGTVLWVQECVIADVHSLAD